MADRFHAHIWLTEAERDLSRRLWGERPGAIIPACIDAPDTALDDAGNANDVPFLLYSGRLDPGKGVDRLCEFFIRFKREHDRPLRLVLTGTPAMKLPRHADIESLGFVDEVRKWSLMRTAAVFVMPSPMESLSIVTLEAMATGTPVLVEGENPVLREHVRKGDGRVFFDYSSFAAELSALLDDAGLRQRVGAKGREYVREAFSRERIQRDLLARIDEIPGR
jgi:glycosyltransferase involved in cell wall biosynthesis